MSTVAIFGAAAFWKIDQAEADRVVEQVIAAGVNHFDVAPSYGQAEERLGPWVPRIRDSIFLGCKTMERARESAAEELRKSLRLLQVDSFDLYQIHAITTQEELDAATRSGGALDAIVEAREAGLTRHIGITGHGIHAPALFLEALRRFEFDSVLFPINPKLYADPEYRQNAEELVRQCRARDVGTMIIKPVAYGPWGEQVHTHTTWYQPFEELGEIQRRVNFALSQDVTGLCTAGDIQVLPHILEACKHFAPMGRDEQEKLIAESAAQEPIFA